MTKCKCCDTQTRLLYCKKHETVLIESFVKDIIKVITDEIGREPTRQEINRYFYNRNKKKRINKSKKKYDKRK